MAVLLLFLNHMITTLLKQLGENTYQAFQPATVGCPVIQFYTLSWKFDPAGYALGLEVEVTQKL